MNFSKIVIAAAILVGGVANAAENVAVQLQERKLQQLESYYAKFKETQETLINLNALLASAKRSEGSWQITLDDATLISQTSLRYVVIPSAFVRAGMIAAPKMLNSGANAAPTTALLKISAGVYVAATLVRSGANYMLNVAASNKLQAELDIRVANEQLAEDRSVIEKMASDIGAKVENHVITFENAPEGLKSVGGGAMNLN